MPQITINDGRVDWPRYRFVACEEDELVLDRFMARHPELFLNSKVLFVLDDGNWRALKPSSRLDPKATYRLASVVNEADLGRHPQRCSVCGCEASVAELRYHSGELVSQEWVHGMTIRWEWTCCNQIVSHRQVEAHDATQGCNVGRCAACRDLTAYQAAIAAREQQEQEAF